MKCEPKWATAEWEGAMQPPPVRFRNAREQVPNSAGACLRKGAPQLLWCLDPTALAVQKELILTVGFLCQKQNKFPLYYKPCLAEKRAQN